MTYLLDLFWVAFWHLAGVDGEADLCRTNIRAGRRHQARTMNGPQEFPRFDVKALEALGRNT